MLLFCSCVGQTRATLAFTKKNKCLKIQFSFWKKLGVSNKILKNLSTSLGFCLMIKRTTQMEKNDVKIYLVTDLLFDLEARFTNKIK